MIRSRLQLPINRALFQVIEEMQANGELSKSGYIFQSASPRRGKANQNPWRPDSVTHWFKKYVRRAGLPGHYALHSCRHTYTTYHRSKGVPQDVIQRLLGHSSVQTTGRHYDHSTALFFRQYADQADFSLSAEPQDEAK